MEGLIEKLMESPQLELYVQKLERALADERQRRHAFYDWVDENSKAEFINGETVVHSPVRLAHNNASFLLSKLLSTYADVHGLGHVGHEKLMVSLTRNDYEPDVCFWGKEKADKFTPGQLRFPAPDFVAEVLSESTEAIDRGVKFEDYAAHGALEYWIVDPERETIEQFIAKDGRFELALKVNSGILKSVAVPGFEIAARAVFDKAENLAALGSIMKAGDTIP